LDGGRVGAIVGANLGDPVVAPVPEPDGIEAPLADPLVADGFVEGTDDPSTPGAPTPAVFDGLWTATITTGTAQQLSTTIAAISQARIRRKTPAG
jgi:hypothetical protein